MTDHKSTTALRSTLAIDADEFRRLGHLAVDLVAAHLDKIADGHVFKPMLPEERNRLLNLDWNEAPTDAQALLQFTRDHVFSHPMGNGHPRFFGWVNSPPAPIGVLAELLASALNPSVAGGDHAAVYLERAVVRWLIDLCGFTSESVGLLVSGGSMANLTCLAAARHWAVAASGGNVRGDGLQANASRLTMYISEEAHGCLRKSAELLGLGESSIRALRVDDKFRMDLNSLREAVLKDRMHGLSPFCVVGTAGTVNTGAIDPLGELADFCRKERLWFHVDGAYGGVGGLDPELTEKYAALSKADSIAIDPHKWLSVPLECGCAIVRNGKLLRETFSLVPPYLQTEEGKGFGGLPWFSEYGFQQTRGFRALKLWMVLAHLGRSGARELVVRARSLASYLANVVSNDPEFELIASPELSIVCFRTTPSELRANEEKLNALNKRIIEIVQTSGDAFVTGTTIHGRTLIRACVLHYATTRADVDALVAAIRRAIALSVQNLNEVTT